MLAIASQVVDPADVRGPGLSVNGVSQMVHTPATCVRCELGRC